MASGHTRRDSAPNGIGVPQKPPKRSRWLALAVVIGLVLYPGLTATLNLLGLELSASLPEFIGESLGGYGTLVAVVVFAVVWWCLRRAGSSLSEVGFPTQWRWWQLFLLGAVIALVALSTVFMTFSDLASPSSAPTGFSSATLAERLGYIFVTAVRAGVVEETIFRGLALTVVPGLLFGGRVWPAVLASTAIFVLGHGDLSAGVVIFRTGISLVFCALFLWRRSLRLPIILHWLINAFPYATIP